MAGSSLAKSPSPRTSRPACSAVSTLQRHVEPIPWPPWIPDDEEALLVSDPPPSDVDAHVWGGVCAAVGDSFVLESDQATWSVDMDQLAMDSLDWVILAISLEKYLSIDLTEDETFELSEQSTIGAIYRFLIRIRGDQLHASKPSNDSSESRQPLTRICHPRSRSGRQR